MLAFFLTLAFLLGTRKGLKEVVKTYICGHNDVINPMSTIKGVKHNIRYKLTYYSLSSSNPNEVSHFVLKI